MTTLVAKRRPIHKRCQKRQLVSITVLLGSILLINSHFTYNALLDDFHTAFNNGDFQGAALLMNKEQYNPIKQLFISKDLTNILTDKLDLIPSSLANDEITYEAAKDIIEQIKKFDLVNEQANSLLETLPSESSEEVTTDIATNADAAQSKTTETVANSSSAKPNTSTVKVCSENINSLSISSKTPYFIYVDLAEQKTYVYKGKKNNWNLLKEFSCSSGIKGDETPTGYYTVKQKGNWFFSKKYNEGAKYWVQFDGNYLFHSFPMSENKTTILDKTLGKPASHGCIRLSVEDSKWLFDTMPANSKILIH